FLGTFTWLLLGATLALSQGISAPRNAEETYAWRLHDQYVASEKREQKLQAAIREESANPGTADRSNAENSQAEAQLKRQLRQLTAEIELQQRLEAEWNRTFYDRYGDLKDSAETIYDTMLNRSFDRIEFRLIHFPFYVNDGIYTGTIADVPGEINLVVQGAIVTGSISGLYFYRAGKLVQAEEFNGTIYGTINNAGVVKAILTGKVGRMTFSGSLAGTINKGSATGNWTTVAITTECGTFKASRNQ
ncbi:MAG TPA: hypothetical protein VLN44_13580, partial [Pyrinomonadaceae bacterium]|nr:hypothetical protein [Pyrinomonadaceae bacterium]